MRYNKYAMPVHPEVLKRDFESDYGAEDDIKELMGVLVGKNDIRELNESEISFVREKIQSLWFLINHKRGINLRDREKLEPVFRQIARILKTNESDKPPYCYRGVRLSNFDPTALSDHYDVMDYDVEFKPKNFRILEHLEGLAYGLRSWSEKYYDAVHWATQNKLKDRVIFKIKNPDIVLDTTPVMLHFKSTRMFDPHEFILNLKNPTIVSVKKIDESQYGGDLDDYDYTVGNLWEVEVKDN